uniref:Sepiapterin reductase n=1 Tax=Gasterosteus aculeatus aculeatus TaxID=481459 RepID=G3NTY5_GASAC|nr:sepiapterin reductase b isoform X1 [Gasterosteus aculeatus aculeatus]
MLDVTNPRTLGRSICIITGASRGFGRALAHEVSRWLQPGSVLLLVARSETLLQELKGELWSFIVDQQSAVHCVAADLSTREGLDETVRVARQEAVTEMDRVLLINNAASLGNLSNFATFTGIDEVNSYLSFNVSSALVLTAGILQAFPRVPLQQRSVVNVSSTFALRPLPSWVLYCTAKAAREMMFRVLAEEQPHVKVLSYSPGPMDTDMQRDILRLTGVKNHLLPCQESAEKLVKLLLDDDFVSGTHLDFFELKKLTSRDDTTM